MSTCAAKKFPRFFLVWMDCLELRSLRPFFVINRSLGRWLSSSQTLRPCCRFVHKLNRHKTFNRELALKNETVTNIKTRKIMEDLSKKIPTPGTEFRYPKLKYERISFTNMELRVSFNGRALRVQLDKLLEWYTKRKLSFVVFRKWRGKSHYQAKSRG